MNKKAYSQLLFYIALFLFRIPNFYILPFFPNAFLTTQAVGRIVIFLGIIFVMYENRNKPLEISTGSLLVLIFFIFQSLSIISALNIQSFLMRYKDVAIATALYFATKSSGISIKTIVKILIITTTINSIYALLIIYVPSMRVLLSNITYDRYFNLISSDINRGRYYSTSYDEVIIPFLLNFGSIGLAVIVSYVTFVANFRTKILSLLFVLGSYLIMFKRKTFYSSSIYLVIGIILVGIVSSRFSINSESFIDRFNLNDNEQTQTITSRQKQIGFGLELGKKLFGVGLGNYYDYVPAKNKTPRGSIDKNTQIQLTEVNDSIHNNFASVLAECGYPTLLIYVLMITYFLLKDIRILFEKNRKDRKLFILSFWGLFIYGFFNPGVALSYQFQYWFYRGIISNENIN